MTKLKSGTSLLVCGGLALAATAAFAGNGVGGVFNLGQVNTVDARTQLTGSTATQQLHVKNSSAATTSAAIFGQTNAGIGVLGSSVSRIGVRGQATGTTGQNYGVYATTASQDGVGGYFANNNSDSAFEGAALQAVSEGSISSMPGAFYSGAGEFVGANGVVGYASRTSGFGVLGIQGDGGFAVYAEGNAHVNGLLSKGSGTFKIDHPVDPENKYLSHSFVESPDMKNVYDGIVVTDAKGEAIVELPEYFEALNRDPRYQLTVIGSFAAAQISQEISGNRFAIRTSEPGVKVSWQVTGIRQDAFARAHPVAVEEDKALADRGRYLHPKEHGKPAELAIRAGQNPGHETAGDGTPASPRQLEKHAAVQP